jgi:hypothetical protein
VAIGGALMKLALAAIFLAFGVYPAFSTEYVAMGPGVGTCGEFAAAYKGDPRHIEDMYFFWAQGYMSGANWALMISEQLTVHNLGAMTTTQQQAHIRSYCNQHPLAPYQEAIWDLLASLPQIPNPLLRSSKPK